MKNSKLFALFLASAMAFATLPANISATEQIVQEEIQTVAATTAPKDYTIATDSKHAYDPFAQLESEEATKVYRETVQYEAGTIIYKVNETKSFGNYKNIADGSDLTDLGIDLTSAEELSRKKVKDGLFSDTYEVIYAANLNGDVWETVDALATIDGVVDAQPNYLYEDTAIDVPTEISCNPHRDKQWYYDPGHLNVKDRWEDLYDKNITAGSGVVVAVIDTGVDYTHNDLASSMWVNMSEYLGTPGIDDDDNGYVDDIYGVSTLGASYYHTGDPMDDNGHGTHVAGIIAMTANNYEGGVGIAYGAKIMAIKAGQATGFFSDTDIVEAINYAVAMGADVINMSFGGAGKSFLVEEALANALSTCVLVAAAGNNGLPTTDAQGIYPDYTIDFFPAGYSYVLGVMATDENGNLASFSNWDFVNNGGPAEYELTAPGTDVWSTLPGNQYAAWDGTSMAAPVVAAAAALIRSAYPDKNMYSSRFIMGQLASATKKTTIFVDLLDDWHKYGALDLEASLNDFPKPSLTVKNVYLFDNPDIYEGNDGDGIIDAGEIIDIGLVLRNQWGMADNVTVKVDADVREGMENPYIEEFLIDTIQMEEVGTFNERNNDFIIENDAIIGTSNPLRFKVSEDCINDAQIIIRITVTASNAFDEDDDTVYTGENNIQFFVQRGRTLSGTIKENMTLTSDNYWIVENTVYIPEGVTVKVEEGTQIQFWGGDAQDPYALTQMAYIEVDGKFLVEGTEEKPVEMFPSPAYQKYGVDIRGGVFTDRSYSGGADYQYSETLGTTELSYVNVINPLLNINKGDHLRLIQNTDSITYRVYADGSIKEQRTDWPWKHEPSIIVANYVTDSCLTNLRSYYHGQMGGNFKNVLFDRCEGVVGTSFVSQYYTKGITFENCAFIRCDLTYDNPFMLQIPKATYSAIYSSGNSKYVFVQFDKKLFDFNDDWSNHSTYQTINILAKKNNGHLAVVNSEEEKNFIADLVVAYGQDAAIGEYYPANSNQILCADGTILDNQYSHADAGWGYVQCFIGQFQFTCSSEFKFKNFLLEYPSDISDDDILKGFTTDEIWDAFIESQEDSYFTGKVFQNNAILNNFNDNVDSWFSISTAFTYTEGVSNAENNYWGTENEKLIQRMVNDADSYASLADIVTTPYLTLESPELETIYPFVTQAYLTDTEGNIIKKVSKGQEVQFHVLFNRSMDQDFSPMVSFGPAEPYTDYLVDGEFVDEREWVGTLTIGAFVDAGTEYIRVRDARAEDDHWLVTSTDAARFTFEINEIGAEALMLQAQGSENQIELNWFQTDFDTLAGYNLYRSETGEDGTFTKINSYLIPGSIREYVDTSVEAGKEYFYYFTVMDTAFAESSPSNVASATPLDNIKPTLTHTRVTSANSGGAISFTAIAKDNIGLEYVNLYWRKAGTSVWNTITMSNTSGDSYFATIAGTNVTPEGIEYYIEISDGTNLVCDGSAQVPNLIVVNYSLVIFNASPSKMDATTENVTATLTGVNFTKDMTLTVGDKVVDYTFVDATQITFTIPKGSMGRVGVTLTDGDRTATLPNAITYTDSNSRVQIIAPSDAKANEEIRLPVVVQSSGAIYGLDLQIKVDGSLYNFYGDTVKFELVEANKGASVSYHVNSSNLVNISVASADDMSTDGIFGYLVLTSNSVTDAVTTVVQVVSAKLNAVEVAKKADTNLVIRPSFTISGQIAYYYSDAGIEGVTVTLSNGMSTKTDENGYYSFTGITSNRITVTPTMTGNTNSAVSAQDAALVLAAITGGGFALTELQRIAADVDGDGVLTALDASYILQKSVEKITGKYPGSNAEWAFSASAVTLNLVNDQSNVDFKGILLGDVSGNWSTTVSELD